MPTTAFGPEGPNYSTTRPPVLKDQTGGLDSWFKDCSAPGAADGTIPEQSWHNVITANLRELVRAGGVTLDNADDLMVKKAVEGISAAALKAGWGLEVSVAGQVEMLLGKGVLPALASTDLTQTDKLLVFDVSANGGAGGFAETTGQAIVDAFTAQGGGGGGGTATGEFSATVVLEHREATDTSGGAVPANTPLRIPLNTEVENNVAGAVFNVAAATVTLPEGTWWLQAAVPGCRVQQFKALLREAATGTVVLVGSRAWADVGDVEGHTSLISGRFTVPAGGLDYEIVIHATLGHATYGLGYAVGAIGPHELYTRAVFRKLT